MDETDRDAIARAVASIAGADALIVAAGAGMGVDSGLPDFRGTQGFWEAYPPYAGLGLGFSAIADPRWFRTDPPLAWGFYGHRLELYRQAQPHAGFAILKRWAERRPHGAFVVTSNVDGHFQRAGFDPARVAEVHGSIHWMQCTRECGVGIFAADRFTVRVDAASFRAAEPLPACPACGALARPNILMFGDFEWDGGRSNAQSNRLTAWIQPLISAGARVVIVELGAGQGVPTIRRFCEQTARQAAAVLVRINPREPEVPPGQMPLPMGALEALSAIDAAL